MVTQACGSAGQEPSAEQVASQAEPILGPTAYDLSCHEPDVPAIELGFEYARIAANSPAFRECITKGFSQGVKMPIDGSILGPYIACNTDPSTPNAQTILTSASTANPTRIVCNYADIGTSTAGYAGVGGVPPTDPTTFENIALGSDLGSIEGSSGPCFESFVNPSLPCVGDATLGWIGAHIYHEVMHQHGYNHIEY
ncbi:MAG: hypothetical protein FWD17_06770, partial [Polyangiaceae bacterium]|nr:hypothetical protein [Polyangiaceae bacterium]